MKKILYSIIVPVYNAEKYLQKCIDSILKQTYYNIELVLVDDGSPDKSGEICDINKMQDDRIKVIHKQNGGVSSARLAGVQEATGDYVLFVDADDWIREDCVEKISFELVKNSFPDVIVYGHYRLSEDETIEKFPNIPTGYYSAERINKTIYPNLIQNDRSGYFPPAVWGKAFRRELILDNMISDKEAVIGEDMACIVPTIYRAKSLYVMHECLYYYRYNECSVTKGKRVFPWGCAKKLASHLGDKMELSEGDFQSQVYRYVVHMLFITAVSQFNSGKQFSEIKENIKLNLNDAFYKKAIKECKFKLFSKGWIAHFTLKHRLYRLIQLYHKFN